MPSHSKFYFFVMKKADKNVRNSLPKKINLTWNFPLFQSITKTWDDKQKENENASHMDLHHTNLTKSISFCEKNIKLIPFCQCLFVQASVLLVLLIFMKNKSNIVIIIDNSSPLFFLFVLLPNILDLSQKKFGWEHLRWGYTHHTKPNTHKETLQ